MMLRGFSLVELVVVVAVVGIGASLGLVSAADAVQRARYHGDRARLYSLVREARDGARDSYGTREVVVVSATRVQIVDVATCGSPGTVLSEATFNTLDVVPPSANPCFVGVGSASGDAVIFSPQDPSIAGAESVTSTAWAGLSTSWNEAPADGYGAAGCDPDEVAGCGK